MSMRMTMRYYCNIVQIKIIQHIIFQLQSRKNIGSTRNNGDGASLLIFPLSYSSGKRHSQLSPLRTRSRKSLLFSILFLSRSCAPRLLVLLIFLPSLIVQISELIFFTNPSSFYKKKRGRSHIRQRKKRKKRPLQVDT